MRILGIRNSLKSFRYCILERNCEGQFSLLNKAEENKVNVPLSLQGDDVFIWYKNEIIRLLDYGPFAGIAIKRNENISSCYSKLKGTMFFDCIATMIALDKNIKTKSYIYNQMHVNKKTVISMTEDLVGKTNKYWDISIADAIASAYSLSNEL